MTIPVKPINEIEEKSEVGLNDKILILDADTEEARLASKDELKGDKGDPGTPGTDGQDGAAATIAVGTTSTLPAGSSATVTNSGTSTAAVFNFGIPKGDKGDQGNPGQDGTDGNGITSVTSSKVGKTTTVTMNFDEGDPYSFQVQDGADGTGSGDVKGPASSVNGDVVVFDGTTGKLIKDGSVALSTLSAGASAGATAVQPGDIGTAAACNTGTSSGNVPILDSNGKLATSTLPGVALTDTFTVSTSADLTTLSSAEQGDIAIATSENKTYVLSQAPYSTAANWKEILTPTGGVTSVNGQTGAVTVDDFAPTSSGSEGQILTKGASGYDWQNAPETANTKTFYLSNTSDLVNAQAALDWYLAGKNPVIVYNNQAYILYEMDGYTISFRDTDLRVGDNSGAGYSQLLIGLVIFYLSSSTVLSIQQSNQIIDGRFLSTNTDYSTPYTPQYNGSPATKKYVDDKVTTASTAPSSPTEGMLWYDTTNDQLKVYDGSNWTGVGGGDVVVSSQANNILQSGMKIRAGEETDYSNLGTYDNNTLYLTVPDSN